MASIRTIKIRKAELKWNTGMVRSLYFNHDKIVDTYKNLIKIVPLMAFVMLIVAAAAMIINKRD